MLRFVRDKRLCNCCLHGCDLHGDNFVLIRTIGITSHLFGWGFALCRLRLPFRHRLLGTDTLNARKIGFPLPVVPGPDVADLVHETADLGLMDDELA